MDLVPRLSLNKHPKDYTNLSFVDARNVRLSDDGAVIMNEEGLEINFVILDAIQRKLKDYKIDDYKIYHIMPCNNELVIFVGTTNTPYKLYLFRYNEKDNTCILFKGELPLALNNGDCKITADFTYNVDNALIISYSIYDCGKDLPIYTINLGEWNDVLSGTNKIPNDKYTDNNKLSILPIVKIPTDVSIEYTSGKSYKGWYNFYIRFKISENNYTQWFSFGPCIHNNTLNNIEILKYCYGKIPVEKAKVEHFTGRLFDCGYARGFSDYISSNNDI